MKCNNCGKELSEEQNFCPECGTKAERSAAPEDTGEENREPESSAEAELNTGDGEPEEKSSVIKNYYGRMKEGTDKRQRSFYITIGCDALIILMLIFGEWFKLTKGLFMPSIRFPLFMFGGVSEMAGGSAVLWIAVSILFIILTASFAGLSAMYVLRRIRRDDNYKTWGFLSMICAAVIFVLVIVTAIVGGAGINPVSAYKLHATLFVYLLLVLTVAGGWNAMKS